MYPVTMFDVGGKREWWAEYKNTSRFLLSELQKMQHVTCHVLFSTCHVHAVF